MAVANTVSVPSRLSVLLFSNSFLGSVVLLVNASKLHYVTMNNVDVAISSFAFNLFYFSKTGKFFKYPQITRPDESTCYQRIIMHIFTTKNMKINKRSQLLELFYGSLPVWTIL